MADCYIERYKFGGYGTITTPSLGVYAVGAILTDLLAVCLPREASGSRSACGPSSIASHVAPKGRSVDV